MDPRLVQLRDDCPVGMLIIRESDKYSTAFLGDEAHRHLFPSQEVQLDFGKIGEQMFGPRALPVLRVFALTECFCICSWCLVFVGEAVASFFPLSKSVVIIIASATGPVLFVMPPWALSYISMLGIIFVLSGAALALWSGATLPQRATDQTVLGTDGLGAAISTASFVIISIGQHAVFPKLYQQAKSMYAYRDGMIIGFLAFLVASWVVGLPCYWFFGGETKIIVLSNVGRDLDGNEGPLVAFGGVVSLLIAARTWSVCPFFVQPISTLIPRIPPVAAAVIVFLMNGLVSVIFAEDISIMVKFVASAFRSINAFVIPGLGFLVLCGRYRSWKLRGPITILVFCGIAYGALGVRGAIHDIR